jgi:hypothetical protein
MCFTLALGIAGWVAHGPAPADAQQRPDRPASEPAKDLAAQAVAGQQPSVLDLVPDDAALVIAIPDLRRLKERGDHLFDQTHSRGLRFSEIFAGLYDFLDVNGVVDESRPVAAMIANLHDVGVAQADVTSIMRAFVVRLPVKDVAEAARRFKLDDEALTSGRIVARDVPGDGTLMPSHVCMRDGYLLLGTSKKAIESALDSRPIADQLSEERRMAAAKADVVVLAGTHPWANAWSSFVERIESKDYSIGQVPAEDELKQFLTETVPDTRFVLLTATIDDGIHLRIAAHFNMGGAAEAALAEIRGTSPAATDLAGLPGGRLLGALSARGDELRTIATARLLAPLALDAMAEAELLDKNDPTRMLGTFDAVRRQLTGVQMALYSTGAATQNELSDRGSMAGVFILEAAQPERVLESLAADGIVLGGRSRVHDDGSPKPRIALKHLPKRESIAGHDVDHLQIDMSSLDSEIAAALRQAFGPAWMTVRAAPLENKLVLLMGTERQLLEQALQTSDANKSDLAQAPPLVESLGRLDASHQAALHLSLQRTLPAAGGFEDPIAAMRRDVNRVSSAAITIERDLLQVELWLPLEEIKAIPQEHWRLWW